MDKSAKEILLKQMELLQEKSILVSILSKDYKDSDAMRDLSIMSNAMAELANAYANQIFHEEV